MKKKEPIFRSWRVFVKAYADSIEVTLIYEGEAELLSDVITRAVADANAQGFIDPTFFRAEVVMSC